MKKLFFIFTIGCLISLTGCGGGGGGNNAAIPNQALDGIWNGSFTSAVLGGTIGAYIVISPNNEMHYVTSQGVQGAGLASVSGSNFSSFFTAFTPPGIIFPNGASIATGTTTGTGTSKGTLTGTYSGGGDNGTFSFAYNQIYDRGASLAAVSGAWAGVFLSTGASVTVNIDAGGVITGSDTNGCVFNGVLSIFDPLKNIYGGSLTQTGCTAPTTATGLAFLSDAPPLTNNILNFALSDQTSSVAGSLGR